MYPPHANAQCSMVLKTHIELVPFGRRRLRPIDLLVAEGGRSHRVVRQHFFSYPLTHSQLERYLECAKAPNTRLVFTARSLEDGPVGHIE